MCDVRNYPVTIPTQKDITHVLAALIEISDSTDPEKAIAELIDSMENRFQFEALITMLDRLTVVQTVVAIHDMLISAIGEETALDTLQRTATLVDQIRDDQNDPDDDDNLSSAAEVLSDVQEWLNERGNAEDTD